jgi:hypothetical protein
MDVWTLFDGLGLYLGWLVGQPLGPVYDAFLFLKKDDTDEVLKWHHPPGSLIPKSFWFDRLYLIQLPDGTFLQHRLRFFGKESHASRYMYINKIDGTVYEADFKELQRIFGVVPTVPLASSLSVPTFTPVAKDPDISDWKTWARPSAGCCACGISREQCDYHR